VAWRNPRTRRGPVCCIFFEPALLETFPWDRQFRHVCDHSLFNHTELLTITGMSSRSQTQSHQVRHPSRTYALTVGMFRRPLVASSEQRAGSP
jgi:hypothetical protein